MAKESGLGMTVAVDNSAGSAQTISNDVRSINYAFPRGVQETTGVDKSAMERLLLLADFSVTFSGIFNPTATTASHAVFSTVPSTSVQRTVTIATVGSPTATIATECIATDYQISRSDSGELTWTVPMALANGAVPTWT